MSKSEKKYTTFADLHRISKEVENRPKTVADKSLTQEDIDNLSSSWITPELAQRAGLFRVDHLEGAETVGRSKSSGIYSGIVFPNIWPGETKAREYRLRRDFPDIEYKNTQPRPKAKYLSPPGRGNLLYFVPGTKAEVLKDTTLPIVITEGEKKTLALERLSPVAKNPFLPLGLTGVWSWRGTVGKETGPKGERVSVKGVIADFDRITWTQRTCLILFDSNVATNPSVARARLALASELDSRGAKVYYIDLPSDEGVNGVDDLLALWGPAKVLELFEQKVSFTATLAEQAEHLTDLGNARRLVRLYGHDLRYCYDWGKWLFWDGKRWKDDSTEEIARRAKRTVATIYAEAADATDEKLRDAIAIHAKRSESQRSISAMISLAQSEPTIPVLAHQLDKDPFLINLENGVLNLSNGNLRLSKRDDLLTKLAAAECLAKAECPQWLTFLNRIMSNNQNLISFLQRAVGYSLSGDTSERVLFLLHGIGANGKTTFLETIAGLLGDYGMRTPTETLLIKRTGAIPNDVARLRGARFVYASETEEGKRLAEALVKDMTGGDKISARFLRAEWFEFLPEFKLWLGTNHKPNIRGTDNAIWDRIRLIPFTVIIPPEERIPRRELLARFRQEFPGILRWAVEGCLEWQRKGLGTPEEVQTATASYRAEMDLVGHFLADCCIEKSSAQVKVQDLHKAYKSWCDANGEIPLGKLAFGTRLTERGFVQRKQTAGVRYWVGIGLLDSQ